MALSTAAPSKDTVCCQQVDQDIWGNGKTRRIMSPERRFTRRLLRRLT